MKRISVLLLLVTAAFAQTRSRLAEYALVLEDPPVAQKVQSRVALQSSQAQAHLQKVRGAQRLVLAELAARKVRVAYASQILVNAIFVRVPLRETAVLKNIPGVKWIQYQPESKPALSAAVNLVGVPAAWSAIGGSANAGAGVKIGIIDTGIDQNHPGFRDSGFTAPAGFPKGDTAYTNSKVIVARSYVSMLVAPDWAYSTPGDLSTTPDPAYTAPDDLSPRDRWGHGTAIAMIAAGVQNAGPLGSITGVAPKAFLGNYKVFGSPGVLGYTYRSAWIQALTDAVNDGMDIVTLSLSEGDPAYFGPLDTGSACLDDQCDVGAQWVENTTRLGTLVVVAAGNGGNLGFRSVTHDALTSPGTAPSALTVGASANSHLVYQPVRVNGGSLGNLHGLMGDGPRIDAPLTAPVKDVTKLGDDGFGCTAFPAASLTGAFALIQRGACYFTNKTNFAMAAGAIGVILYQSEGIEEVTTWLDAQDTGIPAVIIGNSDGKALKTLLGSSPNTTVTLDPAFAVADNPQVNTVAGFSGRGPSVGNFAATRDFALKPELVAPGTNIYTATQKIDPNADTYDASGYTTVTGTSYAVPFAAGVAAMALARNPNLKQQPGRLKSAVVNTASADLLGGIHVTDAGAGKLNAADAVSVAATLEPAAISFGPIATVPVNRTLTLTNVSSAAATFSITVRQLTGDSNARVTVSQSSVNLPVGGHQDITVSLTGSRPAPGSYEGFLDVKGAGPDLHLPYLYVVGDGVPYDIFPLHNGSFAGIPNDFGYRLSFRTVDQYGVPVANFPISFHILAGGGKFNSAGGDNLTGLQGNASVFVDLGPRGGQVFTGIAGGLTQRFEGALYNLPAINSSGVVNAAPPYQVGQGLAPGSYISIFGSDLSGTTRVESTKSLPLSLGHVAVSFDGGGKSLPGRFHFVSPGQINVQIPWEFQGQSSVKVKVTYYLLPSNVYTVPLATYSPGIFAVTDGSNNPLPISAANPAKRGGSIVIYANGLGPVDNPQSSGDPASASPLARTQATPAVTLGGGPTGFLFSGLTPGTVGLYQVNVSIPADAPTGTQALKLSIGGQDTTVNLVVQ
jgi:minor extracellular serine protease Vpr